jgi:methylenetetrahydrofolate--tRNA-(uracil-5-)-methyltransferase
VGLEHNNTRYTAVVQLRQDDAAANLYNMVGFQTHLKWPDQKRIIQMIPGLEHANIVRYGVMHRNTYINAPSALNCHYQSKMREDLFFAGQLTGVEGYVESAASGLYAALNMIRLLNEQPLIAAHTTTMMGAMAHYISHANPKHFVVMNANFGLVDRSPYQKSKDRNERFAHAALEIVKSYAIL